MLQAVALPLLPAQVVELELELELRVVLLGLLILLVSRTRPL